MISNFYISKSVYCWKILIENTTLHILHNLKSLVKSLLEETVTWQNTKIYNNLVKSKISLIWRKSFHYKGFTSLYGCFKIDVDTWNYYHHVSNHLEFLEFFNCKTNFKFAHFNTPEVIILLILLDFANRGIPSFWMRSLSWSHRKNRGFPTGFSTDCEAVSWIPWGQDRGILPSPLFYCGVVMVFSVFSR